MRVSPTTKIKTSSELHASLVESLNVCLKDIQNEGNIPVAIYIDEYVSGRSSKTMPEFQHMLNDAKRNTNTTKDEFMKHIGIIDRKPWKRMYARRVNRFGRNRADMISAEIELSELGYTLKFSESGVDTAKPYGKSIMALLAELAQQDRNEIMENTKRGRDEVLIHGKPTKSGKPFGHPKKEVNIKAIRQLRLMPVKDRMTWKQISHDYNVSVSVMIQKLKAAGFWDDVHRCVK